MKKAEVKTLKYTSTRDSSLEVDSARAIVEGISRDGGLFVPTSIPQVDREFLEKPLGPKSHHLLHTDHQAWEMPPAPPREV